MPATFNPVQTKDRVLVMDALRGFALLGIFIANVPAFNFGAENAQPQFATPVDDAVEFLDAMLVEGKFYSIFSLLFGWGLAMQLGRRESQHLNPLSFARRRLLILLFLGLAHIFLLWVGDIVAFYAMTGLLFLFARNWKDRTLFRLIPVLLLLPVVIYFLQMKFPVLQAPFLFLRETGIAVDGKLTGIESEDEFRSFITNMSYLDVIKLNIGGFFFRYADLFFQSRLFKVLAMFMLGYLLGRNDRYIQVIQNRKLLKKIAVAGLLIGLPANMWMAGISHQDYYQMKTNGLYRTIAYAAGVAPLAIAYTSLFFLAAGADGNSRLVRWLHPAGKMAFTNYLLQSVVATLFFLPFAGNMMGRLGNLYMVLFAITVFVLQVLFSHFWISRFQYGPVEWLWRTATYGKRQAFRKKGELKMIERKEKETLTGA